MTPEIEQHIERLRTSYARLTGKVLAPDAQAVWEAPFVVVSHGIESDPVFNFGNRAALALFELDWDDFIRLPSRKSAEPVERAKRQDLLKRVTRDGFIDDYAGIRISASGRRFKVRNAVVWNVADDAGIPCGQAATFTEWTPV
ncbi:MAG: MEKHLA domain-containing protein [Verrucomicrobiota bacterium]